MNLRTDVTALQVQRPIKFNFTAQTLIEKAIQAQNAKGALQRLLKYDEEFPNEKESLINLLTNLARERLDQEQVLQELQERANDEYIYMAKLWRKNDRTIKLMELGQGFFIGGFFLSIAFLMLTASQYWILKYDHFDKDVNFLFLTIPINFAFLISCVISILNTKRHVQEYRQKISYPNIYPLLGCSLVGSWLMQLSVLVVIDIEFQPLLDLQLISVCMAVFFAVGYRQLDKTRGTKHREFDERTARACIAYFGARENEKNELEDFAVGIVEDERIKLEKEHDIDVQNKWSWEIPVYSSKQPWRKLGERHDQYSETSEFKDMQNHILTLDKCSIGISGERGYGKTALMRALERSFNQEENQQYLTVWISAPTAVSDEKEFLLSVLAKLATCVGAKVTGNEFWPDFSPKKTLVKEYYSKIRRFWALAAIIFSVLCATVIAIPIFESNNEYLWLGVLLGLAVSITLLLLPRLWTSTILPILTLLHVSDTVRNRSLVKSCNDLLEKLWYERKDISTSSISLSSLAGSLVAGQSTEKARQPFTTPHLVQMWDDFVGYVTDKQQHGIEKIMVFIDEVDKMKDVDNIGKFMLILKALYNPMNLFFVVSISDDAYGRFHKRSTPFQQRNEFDSSFDYMLLIPRKDFVQTSEILNERILGYDLPIPAILLIWMLSRGNPRDIVRFAREILTNYQKKECGEIALDLCTNQAEATISDFLHLAAKKKIDVNTHLPSCVRLRGFVSSENYKGQFNDVIKHTKDCISEVNEILSTHLSVEVRQYYEQLRGELTYLLTFYELFRHKTKTRKVMNLRKREYLLKLIATVQTDLYRHSTEQALESLNKFRSEVSLS